jgi:1-phosphofructokinase family hexose kinase
MIRSICLNPVIDRVYFINKFQAGCLYRDTRSAVFSGGKGVNVVKVLTALGEPCVIYGFIAGNAGQSLKADLVSRGIQSRLIEIAGDTRTTINIIDNQRHGETEILERGPTADAVALQSLLNQLTADMTRGDIVICSGAIINGAKTDIYHTVSEICQAKQGYCFLDTYGEILQASLPGNYFFAKPNRRELLEYMELQAEVGEQKVIEAAWRLLEKGLTNLMISMGEKGALLLSREGLLQAAPPVISHQSTIGSGDAAVAGFAAGISRGVSVKEAFKLAMACGVSNAMHKEIGFVDVKEVNEFQQKMVVIKQSC